jgi:hypothetical protein
MRIDGIPSFGLLSTTNGHLEDPDTEPVSHVPHLGMSVRLSHLRALRGVRRPDQYRPM